MTDNPYQPPAVQEVVAPAAPLSGAEAIRSQHLKHEAWLKAVGFFYLLSAILVALSVVALVAIYGGVRTRSESGFGNWDGTFMGTLIAIGIAQFISGRGLRKLRPRAKIPAALVAGFSLFNIPVGTVIGGSVLYLLFCAKGRTVLSPAYAEIIARTPHLRYRAPRWIWIALILIVVVLFWVALFSPAIR
ncbi:hypothetical protein OKA05_11695 [Luteolibacter arcticus]|uniref:Tripartite tricarboxylate transporter TctB family protein n=1 Tax=Luteolibacter arcticus TaxID=1581411 RepID=A0ABT3GI87_9BACT|nr:hypothetical protein [Luteolibacter arcticus]MCW1923218.1 hypothetical protein [Luteolibacter arcticus]